MPPARAVATPVVALEDAVHVERQTPNRSLISAVLCSLARCSVTRSASWRGLSFGRRPMGCPLGLGDAHSLWSAW